MTDDAAWNPDSVTVRRANAGDAAEAAKILIHSRLAAAGAIPAAVRSDEEVRRWVETALIPHCEVWLAESRDDQALALLVLDEDWIDQLYVRPDVAGSGIGSRLIELAKEQRPDGLQLRTFATNPGAQRFYERHGFVIAEHNTGDANEEKRADLRYVWAGSAS